MVDGLNPTMPHIGPAQSAFLLGICISNNILLSHDLIKGFHLDKGPPHACIKVVLRKVFNTIRWDFIEGALRALSLPSHWISLLMGCITGPFNSHQWIA